MGHRFSKTAASAAVTTTTTTTTTPLTPQQISISNRTKTITTTTTLQGNSNCYTQITQSGGANHHHSLLAVAAAAAAATATAPTINLHIQGTSPTSSTIATTTTTKAPSTTTTAGCSQFISEELSTNNSNLSTISNLSCGSQIIIKIQLAKMEGGNETATTTTTTKSAAGTGSIFDSGELDGNQINVATTSTSTNSSSSSSSSNNSSNSNDCSSVTLANNCNNKQITTIAAAGGHILNLTIDRDPLPTTTINTLSSNNIKSSANVDMAANNNNESLVNNNNNNNNNKNNSNFNESLNEDSIEYCEVMGQDWPNNINVMVEEPETNACCRRRIKSTIKSNNMNNETNSASVAALKRRCRKCSCRDAFRRILDTSSSRLTNKLSKQQQQQQQQQQLQINKEKIEAKHSKSSSSSSSTAITKIGRKGRDKEPPVGSKNSLQSMTTTTTPGLPNTPKHSTTTTATIQKQHRPTAVPPTVVMTNAEVGNSVITTAAATTTTTAPNQLLIRATPTNAGDGEVIIPITAPSQFLVVQCAILNATAAPPSILPSTSTNNNNQSNNCTSSEALLSLSKTMELIGSTIVKNQMDKNLNHNNNNNNNNNNKNGGRGSIVHSQVDFRHFLVPDLERITGASFYWGKIDRYEAERLLEDKPEGTFLLRDSAQEEFLFSVTFRKYGRSLHARIEQSGHRFSFDCHDPGVYTASTVMGLLEHYKDPACVMFFEPMLTTPLNRDFSFSLQQLCRATIASHITYDGISELELPARMKSYLKEYHYKQKLRVKPFDELFYTPCST